MLPRLQWTLPAHSTLVQAVRIPVLGTRRAVPLPPRKKDAAPVATPNPVARTTRVASVVCPNPRRAFQRTPINPTRHGAAHVKPLVVRAARSDVAIRLALGKEGPRSTPPMRPSWTPSNVVLPRPRPLRKELPPQPLLPPLPLPSSHRNRLLATTRQCPRRTSPTCWPSVVLIPC